MPGNPYTANWVDASNVHVVVGGTVMQSDDGSVKISNIVGQRSTATLTINDITGNTPFSQGLAISVINGGTKNLLTGNQSSIVADLTGIVVNGSGVTLTRDASTTPPLVPSIIASVKAACDGSISSQGFTETVPASVFVGNTPYMLSAWVNFTASRSAAIIVQQVDSPFTTYGRVDFQGTGGWQFFSIPFTTPAMVTGNGIKIYVITTSSGVASTLWASALQLERDTVASPWHRGQTLGGSLLFGGIISGAKRTRIGYSGIFREAIKLIDWHYLADKRIAATTYAQMMCGSMVKDLITNWLAAEGVTYQRGVNLFTPNESQITDPSIVGFYVGGGTGTGVGPLTAGGVTISVDGSQFNSGEWSMKCVSDGLATFEAVEVRQTDMTKFVQGGVYAISGYVKASSALNLRIYAQTNLGSFGPVTQYAVTTGWVRYSAVFQPTPISSITYIAFRTDTGAVAQAGTWWLDSMQVERVDLPTQWVLGGTGVNSLLTANQSSAETDLTGISTVNAATVTRDTTKSWQGSASIKVVTGGVTADGFSVGQPAGSFTPNGWYTASVFLWGTGPVTLAFGPIGGIAVASINIVPSMVPMRYSVAGQVSASPTGTWGITVTATQAVTFNTDGLQLEAIGPTAWELGGLVKSVQDGPTVQSFVVPYIPVSLAIDELAVDANFFWQIDQNKVLWFVPPTTLPAPWAYDGTQADGQAPASVDEGNPFYRNSQWLLNIKDVTALQTETRKGDGTAKNFSFSYPMHAVPAVSVNGTAKTVGLKGVDDVTHSKNWYWAQGDAVLAQEVNDTVLATTDTVQAIYIGEWINNVLSQDQTQIALEAALEGSGTGLVEEAHADPSITTGAQAFASAAALLARYGTNGREILFTTRWGGLAPGQSLPVNMSSGWLISGVSALIESVDMVTRGPWWQFVVKAVIGPFNQTWVQFLNTLAKPDTLLPGNVGSTSLLTVAGSFPITWPAWSATLTPVVLACPICGPTTLCGAATICC